jgi:hypothetical protein
VPRTLAVLLLLAALGTAQSTSTPLTRKLDESERRAEDLANALLDFAARRAEPEKPFAVRVLATPFPDEPTEHEQLPKWFARHGWKIGAPREIGNEEFRRDLQGFVARHGKLQDLRLKLVGDDRVRLTIVGWRAWTRGFARIRTDQGRIVEFRIEQLSTMLSKRDLFTDVAEAAGVAAEDPPALAHKTLGLAAYGAAAADVNGDGLIDVFSTGDGGNTLYVNLGNGTFGPVAVKTSGKATGPLFLDRDNDGDPDLFLSANGKQMLLENRNGKLVEVAAGVETKTIGFSAAAGDLNGDRIPDIFVTAYGNFGPVLPDSWDDAKNGLANLLFLSRPDGTYEEVGKKLGVAGREWSYATLIHDFDGDHRLDILAANDFGSGNRLHLNQGDGFEEAAGLLGLLDRGYTMGLSLGDYDNDGDLDLHATKMSSVAGNRILGRVGKKVPSHDLLRSFARGNTIFENEGDLYAEAASFPAGWAWGGGFIDIDNDGWEDLHTPNGHLSGLSMKDT